MPLAPAAASLQGIDADFETDYKAQPFPWRSLLLLGFTSIGIHLLALRIPLPNLETASKEPPTIKVTRLAAAPQRKTVKQPTPQPPKQRGQLPPRTNATANPSAIASSAVQSPATVPTRSKPENPTETPAKPQITPPAAQKPVEESSISQKPDPEWKDFPTYPGVTDSPESPALRTSDDFQRVVKYFDTALKTPQQWNHQVVIAEASRKVYQITAGKSTQFLSVLSRPPFGTAYVLASQPTTQEDLRKSEEAIVQLGDVLASIKGSVPTDGSLTAQPELFSQAEAFLSQNFIQKAPEQLLEQYLKPNLVKEGFQIMPSPTTYGGAPIYPIQRELFTAYLHLVPSRDGQGTVMMVWRNLPPSPVPQSPTRQT
ncbi:MAG: hypothetical protein MH252_01910 [Thermosynechococcaceae cyanobacterium MS004]|nr:hypothetical protein [Thermosynechococcaceae cyanobacterium MS004]